MSIEEFVDTALELNEADRIEVARRLLASLADTDASADSIRGGIARIEDVLTGRTQGLTEAEFVTRMG